MKHVQEPQVSDRLLALAGTLECDVTDKEDTMSATMQETSTNQPQESEGGDRLSSLWRGHLNVRQRTSANVTTIISGMHC